LAETTVKISWNCLLRTYCSTLRLLPSVNRSS
jgi:hypothetical protein